MREMEMEWRRTCDGEGDGEVECVIRERGARGVGGVSEVKGRDNYNSLHLFAACYFTPQITVAPL